MRIRIAVPDAHVSEGILNAALEATTLANLAQLNAGETPPVSHLIDSGKVKWKPEPFKDGEHFDLTSQFQNRGWADCDDLAPAAAAEARASGYDPGARAVVKKSGPNLWHAVMQYSDGEIYDPSKDAGMGKTKGVHGRSVLGMVGPGGVFGFKPHAGKWIARCDLRMEGMPASICGLSISKSPLAAIEDAIDGATLVGGASDACSPEDIARALAIRAACAGDDYGETIRDLAGHMHPEEVGSFFSSIADAVKSVVPAAASFIPIPGAGLAAQALTHLIPGTPEHHAAQAAQAAHAAAPRGGGGGGGGGGGAPSPLDDWALKIKKGVHVERRPGGAFVIQF